MGKEEWSNNEEVIQEGTGKKINYMCEQESDVRYNRII